MTSKSLCFKLMKEDLKRRVWTIALTILSLVFLYLIPAAIKSGAYLDQLAEGMNNEKNQRWIREFLGVNGVVVAALVILAAVWAVSGFHYLHNSRQVDFYHSIPVKRYQLFLSSYFNGILVTAAAYFVIQAAAVGLILRTGIRGLELNGIWWKIFLLNMLYYIMLYTTTVIAMMMTGNLIIALLGTVVFCGYGPAVVLLTVGYESVWFHTFCQTERQSAFWLNLTKCSSPFSNYMFALTYFSEGSLSTGHVAAAAAVTAVLAVLAYLLYHLRPSESAGKAMAFRRTQSPIKILIALPVAVFFGMVFYSLRSTLSWGIFGTVCGAVIICCLMEIIYHFDFRKLFANWIQMAACGAVSVLLMLAGMYDWYGYDSWLPKASDVRSASVSTGYRDDWVTYGWPRRVHDYDSKPYYTWQYQSQREYQYKNMELTDIYTVMELAQKGVRTDKEIRARGLDGWDSWRYENGVDYDIYVVHYRLNSGKEVNREYRVPVDDEMKTLEQTIHDSAEYKKGTYPVLSQSAADTEAVYFRQYDQLQLLEADGEEKERLLAVYQKDLEELTMETRKKELPIGTIQFRTLSLAEAMDYNEANDRGSNLTERCWYPVYPSFTRTIEAIREAGGTVEALNADMISEIRIRYEGVYEENDWTEEEAARAQAAYEGRPLVYDDPEEINILSKALIFRDYHNMNVYYEVDMADNVDIEISFSVPRIDTNKKSSSVSCMIDMGRLTEEEIRRFGFMRYEEFRDLAEDTEESYD